MACTFQGDRVTLQGRWFEPTGPSRGLAVIAHPYGFLGGSQDDVTVKIIARILTQQGLYAVTYNARGIGESEGRGSWSLQPEAFDMRLVVQQAMEQTPAFTSTSRPLLYIVGYSAGSLQASTVRPMKTGRWADAYVQYVLLSYPLGVRWALTSFHTLKFNAALEELIRLDKSSSSTSVCVIYTTRDQFTSQEVRTFSIVLTLQSYATWIEHLRTLSPHLVVHRVEGDHYWREPSMQRTLIETLRAPQH
ncbi:hypothetical protein Malapachy_2620 [Malassezia pachydermatis]|uniref:Serine aminopeptidase S33 domain-containing protein n=1 Tax=Malassezia pachydermatis TaxID=77020 RepID=A0A0M8MXL6_9BASI|nr:hypothetical protein Malapachy_2620 [Malassezia pachydermatis]KOS15601.1 hypothetical protein Malapachy_2620 [Malassezia pachydermatis]